MTPDGSIHVLIRELRTLANELSAEDQDVRAAHVWSAIRKLHRALSLEARAHLEAQEAAAADRLRLGGWMSK
jgi:hypothetical protein